MSLVENAFSKRLDLDICMTMVVDLMHEVESGDWRAIFIHLIRILSSLDPSLVNEMDRRCVNCIGNVFACVYLFMKVQTGACVRS